MFAIVYRENIEAPAEIVAKYRTKREAVQAVQSIGGHAWGGRSHTLPSMFTFPNHPEKPGTAYIMKLADAKTYVRMTEREGAEA